MTESVSQSFHKPRILCVEDDYVNWLVDRLAMCDFFDLDRAPESKSAFELVKQHFYDVILMDVQLPGSELNGLEIAEVLRGLRPHPEAQYLTAATANSVIIFVTACYGPGEGMELLARGGDEVVVKPVDFSELAGKIAKHAPALSKTIEGLLGYLNESSKT